MNQLLQWLSDLFQGAKAWTVVMPWERAVCIRLGRWVRPWEPGLHFRVPFLDQVRVINTRLRMSAVPCVTVTTRDGKTVTAAGCVGFTIADPYRALLTVQQPEHAASALGQAALAAYITARSVDELRVAEMESAALTTLQAAGLAGFEFVWVKTVDFAVVRTFRLLQEQWRPSTDWSNFEPPKP